MATKQLSQHDIDGLLSRLHDENEGSQPGKPAKQVKPYDFWHPDKFSKDHLRGLQMVFDTFARLAGSTLSSLLRGQVQVRLAAVEQLSYSEYVSQLPNPTVISLITCDPLPDQLILEINLPIAYVMMDRLLGGTGVPASQAKEVTDIEQSLTRSVIQHLLPNFAAAWSPVVAIEPRLEGLMFNTSYIPTAVSGTVAALALLEINGFGTTGTISVAIPYTVLEPVMARLNAQKWLATPRRTAAVEDSGPEHRLRMASVSLTAILGSATAHMRDLVCLQPGDIVRLDTMPGEELRVAVGEQAKFAAVPGLMGNRLAIQITRRLPAY